MPGYNWMGKYVSDDRKLSNIIMPGSHDAGVYEGESRAGGSLPRLLGFKNLAVCQNKDLWDQLQAGSRVFDLRARMVTETNRLGEGNKPFTQKSIDKKGKVIEEATVDKGRVRFYHGGNWGGTKGGEVESQLRFIKLFLQMNKSEFCILRFTKTKCPNALTILVYEILGDVLYKGTGNLAKHKIGLMRGRAIAAFDDTFVNTFNYFDQSKGFHRYKKKDKCDTGLGICGSYANSPVVKIVVNDQKKKLDKWNEKVKIDKNLTGDRLYAWYQTQTRTPHIKYFTNKGVGSKTESKQLKHNLKHDEAFGSINIVLMDFVDNYKCRKVYRQNGPNYGETYYVEYNQNLQSMKYV